MPIVIHRSDFSKNEEKKRESVSILVEVLGGWICAEQTTPLEKYFQNYEIFKRCITIVIHRSDFSKNEEKKEGVR